MKPRPAEVPEDALAEQDLAERRERGESVTSPEGGEVPEEVLAELDEEARVAEEELRQGGRGPRVDEQ